MFCDQCGGQLNKNDTYCDKCGYKNNSRDFVFSGAYTRVKNISFFSKINSKLLLVFLALIFVFGIFLYAHKEIRDQRQVTANLENQINAVKQQSENIQKQDEKSTQDITDQLNTQKTATADAQKQAQEAKAALALTKSQKPAVVPASNNSFPTINTRAIVLVVCFDNLGNITQSGSGTIVNSQGHVLTNRHVVTSSSGALLSCAAVMNDGGGSPALQTDTLYYLTLSGYYPSYDAALLQISYSINTRTGASVLLPTSFPYITPQGGNLKQGDTLYIFGYPGASNFLFNVTRGIVSSLPADGIYINTDAIIDHGNSGGAAITADGRFVGIPTSKYVADGDYLGQILNVNNLNVPN